MKQHKFWAAVGTALAIFAFATAVVVVPPAQAQTYKTIYSFQGSYKGAYPYAGLIRDDNGTLYGTTTRGGRLGCQWGLVFTLDKGNYGPIILYSFSGVNGAVPYAPLLRDSAGNLYGTTYYGGAYNQGTVFKLGTVLHTFTGGADGANPYAGLVQDSASNLYGTTVYGGIYGAGVVFKLDKTGAESVLHSFTGSADGANPYAGLVRDNAGSLYGTAYGGGAYGNGVVFKLDKTGAETVLYSFAGGGDGGNPVAGLVRDAAGNLYGTTTLGYGTLFKVDKTGNFTTLYSFTGADGATPYAGVVLDPAGNLYGTTVNGGFYGAGVVFKLDTTGAETVLHSFGSGEPDGANPYAGLWRGKGGNLWGTTAGGGRGLGTAFKIIMPRTASDGASGDAFGPSAFFASHSLVVGMPGVDIGSNAEKVLPKGAEEGTQAGESDESPDCGGRTK